MYKLKLFLIFILVSLLSGCFSMHREKKINLTADSETITQNYKDWFLYKKQNICYIASYPVSSSGNYLDRNANYIIISYNPDTEHKEISVVGGLLYDQKEYTKIEIETTNFFLINKGQRSWAVNNDEEIIKALANNPTDIVVFNKFKNNIQSTDKYSTKGLNQAIRAFNATCTDYLYDLDLDNNIYSNIIKESKK